MEFLKKFDLTGTQFLKLIAVVLIGVIALIVLSTLFTGMFGGHMNSLSAPSSPGMMQESYSKDGMNAPMLSIRNVADTYMSPTGNEYAPGDMSEAFEVKNYSAQIETRTLDRDCTLVSELKSRTDVIFENANEHDRGCSYTFKVKKESIEEILGIIKALDPENLSENVYTIKREVDDYTSEVEILKNKLASLDATLTEAIASYENITALATDMNNVESLTKIIESKLLIIERLTTARIDTSNQLDRLLRAKADALDQLEYTYFSVNIYENKFIDGDMLKSSWKSVIQNFFYEVNTLLQDISVGLIAFILSIVKFALYLLVLLLVAKFGWSVTKRIWKS